MNLLSSLFVFPCLLINTIFFTQTMLLLLHGAVLDVVVDDVVVV